MSFAVTACGDDDDDNLDGDAVESLLPGTWICTSCDVTNISGLGIDLPDEVKSMITTAFEDEMIGSELIIPDFSTGKVKLNDEVMIISGSSIQYNILKLDENYLCVKYDASSAYGGYGLNMTVMAEFRRK